MTSLRQLTDKVWLTEDRQLVIIAKRVDGALLDQIKHRVGPEENVIEPSKELILEALEVLEKLEAVKP